MSTARLVRWPQEVPIGCDDHGWGATGVTGRTWKTNTCHLCMAWPVNIVECKLQSTFSFILCIMVYLHWYVWYRAQNTIGPSTQTYHELTHKTESSDAGSVVAERSSLPDSSSGVSSRMWVRIPAVTLVSLSKTLNHNCFSPSRG